MTAVTEKRDKCRYHFLLRPFAPVRDSWGLTLGGSVCRSPGVLSIDFRLKGDLQNISWPASNRGVSRSHDLWRQTCFELFFGIPGNLAYWEVNVCPDGCWNVYHFNSYRQDMAEVVEMDQPFFQMAREEDTFSLSCRIDVQKLVPDIQGLEAGVAGVIFDRTGTAGYWALHHPGAVPDFHSRQSFLIVFSEVTKT